MKGAVVFDEDGYYARPVLSATYDPVTNTATYVCRVIPATYATLELAAEASQE